MGFSDSNWFVISFYLLIILLIILNRKKFDIQHKFLAMYRTKIGIGLMNKWSTKYKEYVKLIGYIGIGAGFVGLVLILYFLLKNLFDVFFVAGAQSGVALVVPGVSIPGSPIKIPLISGWIALAIVIIVHEFSHGLVARAHDLKIKSSGLFFLGPLMGAFVEPDEKKLRKASDTTQYSVYAAGPFSNILLALVCLLLLNFLFTPAINALNIPVGIPVVDVYPNMPAVNAGIRPGMIITAVDNVSVTTFAEFSDYLKNTRPNESITIVANNTAFSFITTSDPANSRKAYVGVITSLKSETKLKYDSTFFSVINWILLALTELLVVIAILSSGIGLANLLPLGPVDGGRMMQVALHKIKGKEKGNVWWQKLSILTLFILLINILWPAIQWLSNFIFGV